MKRHLGLASKKCVPCEAGKVKALSDAEVNSYRNQTPGWQIVTNAQGHRCLRQQWKVKSFKAGLEAFDRIGQIAEEEGHHPDLHLEGYNTVAADLSTHSVGEWVQGLIVSDTIQTDLMHCSVRCASDGLAVCLQVVSLRMTLSWHPKSIR